MMKLKEYAEHITALSKKHPNLEVAYARDDEGNGYDYVQYKPSISKIEINGDEVTAVLVN